MDISNIAKVYNGKRGCMCGCLGKYSYNEGAAQYAWDEVNVRSVKKIVSNPRVQFDEAGEYAYVEDRLANKNQVVYFKTPQFAKS